MTKASATNKQDSLSTSSCHNDPLTPHHKFRYIIIKNGKELACKIHFFVRVICTKYSENPETLLFYKQTYSSNDRGDNFYR